MREQAAQAGTYETRKTIKPRAGERASWGTEHVVIAKTESTTCQGESKQCSRARMRCEKQLNHVLGRKQVGARGT